MSDQGLDEIRRAKRELDAVIEEIRTVPGFEEFLAPASLADVIDPAGIAPIVYLVPAEPGGIALVVYGDDVHHIALDGLKTKALRARVDDYLASYAQYRGAPNAGSGAWSSSLDEICAWLWDVVMGLVLEDLVDADEATLVAGGLLGLLPLHAAWTPDDDAPTGRRYALDAMPLSYAPNARSITAAHAIADEPWDHRLLAVVEPRPVAGARLPSAPLEGEVARAAFPDAPVLLVGGRATRGNLERNAHSAGVLHLACHGYANLATPLESGLRLAGNRDVTLRDLLAMRLRLRLAVLSACETSLPGPELPDEVVALPTGLLQAGAAGVVGSLWAVPDRATAMLMTDFYRRWRWVGCTPGRALRDAQCWLRDTTNADKRRTWQNAEAEDAPWLPRTVARDFIQTLSYAEPDAIDHSTIRSWAAFAHVGV